MKHHFRMTILILLIISISLVTAACAAVSESGEEPAGQAAFVDDVTISERDGHSYATTMGHYPDACSRVSDVQQNVEGNTINIQLFVDRPADMMCAQMLTPFTVDILLETGGLAPGEYTVNVNERSAVLVLGG